MKARQLIDGASFGPEELKVIGQAFDEAWATIAGCFGDSPQIRESARIKLANVVLSVATEDCKDPEALAKAALEIVAFAYRTPEISGCRGAELTADR